LADERNSKNKQVKTTKKLLYIFMPTLLCEHL
jgi:hypothetical protein